MRHLIPPDRDPMGAMLLDYTAGNRKAALKVHSPDLEIWEMTGRVMFRTHDQMSPVEQKALALCRGRILDVGAGSGCHSLWLGQHHDAVTAIDISPGCVAVMEQQGVANPLHANLFDLEGRYDTLLLLMNGLGICGDLDGLCDRLAISLDRRR